jgi:hypothetical protein
MPPRDRLYIPVHSPIQQDLKLQEQIAAIFKTQFKSANWEHIRSSFKSLAAQDPTRIDPRIFLILDQQSTMDRKVIIMYEGSEQWFTPDGDFPDTTEERNDLVKRHVWDKYWVPFEEAYTALCAIEGCCGTNLQIRISRRM